MAMVRAIRMQRSLDNAGVNLLATVGMSNDGDSTDTKHDPVEHEEFACPLGKQYFESANDIMAWDDVDGPLLDPGAVRKARQEELKFYPDMDTYDVVRISECLQRTGRQPIDVRWVDLNKGDQSRPQARLRLVAKHINTYKDMDVYAATPPAEALRTLMSMATSGSSTKAVVTCDVSRAYMYAPCRGDAHVRIADEAKDDNGSEGLCW